MEATNFDQANCVVGPPPGVSENDVCSLYVFRGQLPGYGFATVSCFKVTEQELEVIRRTGRVWLIVLGANMFPTALSGLSPFPVPPAGVAK